MHKKVLMLICLSAMAVASAVWTSRSEADTGEARYGQCPMVQETCCGHCKLVE